MRGYRVEANEFRSEFSMGGYDDWSSPGIDSRGAEPRTASAPAAAAPSVVIRSLQGNTAYKFKVWAMSEAGPGPTAEVLGCTSAVPPGACGAPYSLGRVGTGDELVFGIEWAPPLDTGGAAVVAYRVWLRPLMSDRLGGAFPAEGWIDLGLFEHQGGQGGTQYAQLRLDALPSCPGCLCRVAAINAAGHTGQSSPEVPLIVGELSASAPVMDIHELHPAPRDESLQGLSNAWDIEGVDLRSLPPSSPSSSSQGYRGRAPLPARTAYPRTDGLSSPAGPPTRVFPGSAATRGHVDYGSAATRVQATAPSWALGTRGSLVAGRPASALGVAPK